MLITLDTDVSMTYNTSQQKRKYENHTKIGMKQHVTLVIPKYGMILTPISDGMIYILHIV